MSFSAYSQIDPKLDDIGRKIKACSNIPDTPNPGDKLAVTIALPTELNGSGQCEAGRRAFLTRRLGRVLTRRGRTIRIPLGTATTRLSGGLAMLPAGTDILCETLPGGCPGPIDTGGGISLKIKSVNVKWTVHETVNGRRGRALTENEEFTNPTKDFSGTFFMAPLHFAELTKEKPTTKLFFIVATLTVTADRIVATPPSTTPVTSSEIPIEIPVSLSALQVPKVFVLFLDTDFGGAAAIYLPANSSLNKTTLPEQIGRITETYGNLRDTLSFVGWFGTYLTGLESLRGVFELPHWDLKELKNKESNLNDDDFIDRGVTIHLNDIEVEDESSSLLLIGIPDTRVEFFQDRGFSGRRFTAKTGTAMTVLIKDFRNMTTIPEGGVESTTYTNTKTPNDSLSSFKWK